MDWIDTLQYFNTTSVVVRLLLAMLLGGCIGMERERSKRPAGFRTHILVCVGASLTALIGLFTWEAFPDATDPLRISAQVISGIGFLGVGTIMVKEHDRITGLTTAAGLWATAAIGIACGYGFYSGAIIGSLVVAITSAILFRFESRRHKKNTKCNVYMEISDTKYLNRYIDWAEDELKSIKVLVTVPRSGTNGNVGLEIILPATEILDKQSVLDMIRNKEGVVFAMEIMHNDRLK